MDKDGAIALCIIFAILLKLTAWTSLVVGGVVGSLPVFVLVSTSISMERIGAYFVIYSLLAFAGSCLLVRVTSIIDMRAD